ncbi:MAG TPA: molybdopterin-guanine dinucleotide biosynthesis protein B [Lautropia sp.]|nr:molybdopterin-guanine dinucleotide biosynthesis protein B [Lautropia sp.]
MKVFGFAGYSGSGKTTLIEQLIPRFVMRGLRVSLIKHAHHSFDIDKPGKDSYRHREAGAGEILLTSASRWVLMHELRGEREPGLREQLRLFSPCDLVLVEGYKSADIPKIEVHRPSTGKPLLHPGDPNILAVASDAAIAASIPLLDLNDLDAIAEFIMGQRGLQIDAAPRSAIVESP